MSINEYNMNDIKRDTETMGSDTNSINNDDIETENDIHEQINDIVKNIEKEFIKQKKYSELLLDMQKKNNDMLYKTSSVYNDNY